MALAQMSMPFRKGVPSAALRCCIRRMSAGHTGKTTLMTIGGEEKEDGRPLGSGGQSHASLAMSSCLSVSPFCCRPFRCHYLSGTVKSSEGKYCRRRNAAKWNCYKDSMIHLAFAHFTLIWALYISLSHKIIIISFLLPMHWWSFHSHFISYSLRPLLSFSPDLSGRGFWLWT